MPIERFDDPALPPVITYPRDAVLEKKHLCAAFNCSDEILDRMDLPCVAAGAKPRYLWGQVLDVLAERALPTVGPGANATKRVRRTA